MEGPKDPTEEAAPVTPAESLDTGRIKAGVVLALKDCYDPEIPVDIYELGLIYAIDVDERGKVKIQMTLTSPACPVAGSLPGEVEKTVRKARGVTDVEVELVWDPPWDREMMSEAAMLKLGFF